MKTPMLLLPAILLFTGAHALAQDVGSEQAVDPATELPDDFTEVDTDGDGQVSMDEAREVLPDVAIEDSNNDSMLNRSELEAALPNLSPEERREVAELREDTVIGEEEYGQLLQALRDRG